MEDQVEPVYRIRFNRRPREMHDMLAQSSSLQACRDTLAFEGFDWKLSSGPCVFVHPRQYDLSHCDVVVTETLEYLLEEALSNIGKGVWAKTREVVSGGEASSSSCHGTSGTNRAIASIDHAVQRWTEVLGATRSFLCIAPSLRHAASVIQSSTNSRIQPFANPRRAQIEEH